MAKNTSSTMDDNIAIAKALSDPNRVRALFALQGGELCVCQIIELLGLAPSTVSKHMSILKQAGLVSNRKEERWMHYRLVEDAAISALARSARSWVFGAVGHDAAIRADRASLDKIRAEDLTRLCKVQRSR